MEITKIVYGNVDFARSVFVRIFPKEDIVCDDDCFSDSIKKNMDNYCYFLANENGVTVGMFGIYEEKSDSRSAWLGWFGVLPEFRRRGYGKSIINEFENYSRSIGYDFVRLYTDKNDNDGAIAFYKKCGYVFEEYNGMNQLDNPVLIASKSLHGELEKWNDRELDF